MADGVLSMDGPEELTQKFPAIWRVTYGADDLGAFDDPARLNTHFGLPLPMPERVFSISLNPDGRSNVHDAGKKYRRHYFGNTMVLRIIKQQHPDAWIWDERYKFRPTRGFIGDDRRLHTQAEFVRIIGEDRIDAIHAAAVEAGLDNGGKMIGLPDIAVYMPDGSPSWRFIEIKIPERNDKLRASQTGWLRLLSTFFGREAAVECLLVKTSD